MIPGPPGPALREEERNCNLQSLLPSSTQKCTVSPPPRPSIQYLSTALPASESLSGKQSRRSRTEPTECGWSKRPQPRPRRKPPASAVLGAPQAGDSHATEIDVPVRPHPHHPHFLHGVRRVEKRKEELSELQEAARQALLKKGWGGVGWKRERSGRKGEG